MDKDLISQQKIISGLQKEIAKLRLKLDTKSGYEKYAFFNRK